MFSSRLFTAEAPVASQAKTGKPQAGTEALAAGENSVKEQAGVFAKEFQAVVNEEQNDAAEPVAEPVTGSGQAQLAENNENDSVDAANLLNENIDADSENSPAEANGKPAEQNSAGQAPDKAPGLDPDQKQQIMSDGEELLSRLSESNRQLAGSQRQAATSEEHVPEGKTLPPEPSEKAADKANPLPQSQSQLQPGAQVQAELSQTPAEHLPVTSAELADTAMIEDGDNQAVAAQMVHRSQPVLTRQGKLAAEEQAAGISQEELARVFSPQGTHPQAVDGQALAQDSSEADKAAAAALVTGNTAAMNTDGPDVDGVAPATGEAKTATKGSPQFTAQPGVIHQQPVQQAGAQLNSSGAKELLGAGELPAGVASADLAPADVAGEETALSERPKLKAGAMAIPAALATTTAPGSPGQPSGSESGQTWLAGMANPSGNATSMAPHFLAAGTAEGEVQPAGTSAMAAGSEAAAFAALEQGLAASGHGLGEHSGEAKAAELNHSLSGVGTLQGQANSQVRAEAVSAQSPLQLSKEQAGDQLAERVQMMMSKNLKHVDIRLDPPELGKLHIKLSVNQDQASVQFTVGNQQTRDLVEHAMPRLRELLNQQGLQLAQSSVQQESPRQQFAGQPNQQQGQQGGNSQHHGGSSHGQESGAGSAEPVEMYVSQRSDRVDYYA